MTAIDRLTAAQSLVAGLLQDSIDCPEPDCGDHDLPIAKAIPFTADLAAVLAVVEAAQAYVDECAGLGDAARVIRTFDALLAALAAIEGSTE